MKNITVSVDDELYHRAHVHAAQNKTSVSALAKLFLAGIIEEDSEFERLKRQEREIRQSIEDFSACDRLSREEVHDRNARR